MAGGSCGETESSASGSDSSGLRISETLLNDLRKLVADRQVVAVVGAGVTVGASGNASVASWEGLLRHGVARCVELGRESASWADTMAAALKSGETDAMLSVAEQVASRLGAPNGGEYRRWLHESVGALSVVQTDVLEALRDLGVLLATTNYDGLLEEVTGLPPVTWRDSAQVERVLRGDEQGILHLHGYWPEPESVVLGSGSYELVAGNAHAQAVLRALRTTRSFLFIGFGAGLSDPNFGALLRWSREAFAESEYRQYRLARTGEVEPLQLQHPNEERVFVLPYGDSHDDLGPFLRSLGSRNSGTSALLPAAGHRPPPQEDQRIWGVPLPRNHSFTGRRDLLERLEQGQGRVADNANAMSIMALHGLGGIGKTQLAVEYAYENASDYDIVWWLRADQESTLSSDYESLASEIGLPEAVILERVTTKDAKRSAAAAAIEAVRRWLERGGRRWLLVFDNADRPDVVDPYLPLNGAGHVLITTRNPNWPVRVDTLPVPVLSPDEATAFLVNRTGQHDEITAGILAEELGYLPLALEQASAYVRARGLKLGGYLERFQIRRGEVLRRGEPSGYKATVATTWELSFQAAAEQASGAADLLNIAAFLDPDTVPLEVLAANADAVLEPLRATVGDPIRLDDAVMALRRYSLVEAIDDWTLSVHRLVQSVVRDRLAKGERRHWATAALHSMVSSVPDDSHDPRTWSAWDRLLPSLLAVERHCTELGLTDPLLSKLYGRVGVHLSARGRSAEARPMLERSLALVEAEHGPADPELATGLHHYARTLLDLADLDGALQAVKRALAIDESVHEPDHIEVANDHGLMGNILRQQGKLRSAQDRHERALAIRVAVLGPDHPEVATSMNDLGNVLRQQGNYHGARQLHERALRIHEEAFGPNHPEVGVDLANLGQDLHRLGELSLARDRLERALAINEELYGADHPMVANVLGNLGRVLRAQNNLAGAQQRHERALGIDERAYGPEHPSVATDSSNLADVLQTAGNLAGAQVLYERALQVQVATYGPDHQYVASAQNNLATVLERQRDLSAARAGFERAITIGEVALGSDHPAIAVYSFNLANVLQQNGELAAAAELLERARRIYEPPAAVNPSDRAQVLSALAAVRHKLGDLGEAKRILQEALPIWRSIGEEQNAQRVLHALRQISEQQRNQARPH